MVAVTFDPHPMAVLRPEHAPLSLTDVESRSALLAEAGVDDVYVIAFSREIAAWSPQEFVERVLVDGLHAKAVVVGANFRFGARAAGDVATLREEGERHDFEVEGIALDGGPQVWSSTYVRTCLAAGDVEGAAEALGRPYTLAGTVVGGERRGRELGYPTANVPTHGLAAPADGVYAGWLSCRTPRTSRRCRLRSASAPTRRSTVSVNAGSRPTCSDRSDLELYDVRVQISFVARIRGMVAFDGVDALLAAMADDVERARASPRGHRPARQLGVEVLLHQRRDLVDRCLVVAGDLDRGALACAQGHDQQRGAGVDRVVTGHPDGDLGVQLAGRLGDDRGGAGVQADGGSDGRLSWWACVLLWLVLRWVGPGGQTVARSSLLAGKNVLAAITAAAPTTTPRIRAMK